MNTSRKIVTKKQEPKSEPQPVNERDLSDSKLNTIIQKAIECPMMDCLNISHIIESYSRYNIVKDYEVTTVHITKCATFDEYTDIYSFLYDGEYYYILSEPENVKFINGHPYRHDMLYRRNYDVLYLDQVDYTRAFRIVQRYNTYTAFYKAYQSQIYKWYKISHLNKYVICIELNDISVYSPSDDIEDDIHSMSEEIYHKILNLFSDI